MGGLSDLFRFYADLVQFIRKYFYVDVWASCDKRSFYVDESLLGYHFVSNLCCAQLILLNVILSWVILAENKTNDFFNETDTIFNSLD